ncbi:MAG: hypothetical protein Q9218_000725 [Villophora microphyllina]
MAPQCSALNISDQLRCEEVTTRNVQLDELEKALPYYLASSSVPLANQSFADVDSDGILQEVHDHLSRKHALLDRAIRARKLHHSRLFSLELDYGHQHYLDILCNQKFLVSRALERLERRTAEVLYEKQKWFKWVRQLENDEETHRENEKKKIKREAALFRRHEKEVQRRKQELKTKEYIKKQEAVLEEALRQRQAGKDGAMNEDETEEWDTIEDALDDECGSYIVLIKHFLLLVNSTVDESDEPSRDTDGKDTPSMENLLSLPSDSGSVYDDSLATNLSAKNKKAKRPKNKTDANGSAEHLSSMSAQDTTEQIRKRLKEGVKHSYARGQHVAGTIDNPVELQERTAPLPDDEIDQLLLDVAEIKQLLLCRLLLSHATLLPAALNAASVEDFLNDKDIADADLRDICLKVESPGLQQIRDACADLGQRDGDENDVDEDKESDTDEDDHIDVKNRILSGRSAAKKRGMPRFWAPKWEKQMETRRQIPQELLDATKGNNSTTVIDFGDLDSEKRFKARKIRVKGCGKYIYNYPCEKSVPRRGWLQFSIIAKDSHLYDVIKLCRYWDEFWELNRLVNYRYFPAAHWLIWKGDQSRQQLLKLGFVPYFSFDRAEQMTQSAQNGSRRGPIRQSHVALEARNVMCAHLDRNDPKSRRFLQYISVETHRVVTLVRDAKTRRILKTPPSEHLWLVRTRSAYGRASKAEWEIRSKVGPEFFEQIEGLRQWHFNFREHYDVYIWDLMPGEHYANLYNTVQQTLLRAHRCCQMKDMSNAQRPILETLTREMATIRVRDINPGEMVHSVWDDVMHSQCVPLNMEKQCISDESWGKGYLYNEADAAEDSVLFPNEMLAEATKFVHKGGDSAIDDYLRRGPDWDRFIMNLETDEEFSDRHESDYDSSTESGDTWSDEGSDGWTSSSNDGKPDRSILEQKRSNPSSLKGAVYTALQQDTLRKLSGSNDQESGKKSKEPSARMMQEYDEFDELRRKMTDEQA